MTIVQNNNNSSGQPVVAPQATPPNGATAYINSNPGVILPLLITSSNPICALMAASNLYSSTIDLNAEVSVVSAAQSNAQTAASNAYYEALEESDNAVIASKGAGSSEMKKELEEQEKAEAKYHEELKKEGPIQRAEVYGQEKESNWLKRHDLGPVYSIYKTTGKWGVNPYYVSGPKKPTDPGTNISSPGAPNIEYQLEHLNPNSKDYDVDERILSNQLTIDNGRFQGEQTTQTGRAQVINTLESALASATSGAVNMQSIINNWEQYAASHFVGQG